MKTTELLKLLENRGVEIPDEIRKEIVPETQKSLLADLMQYVKSITNVDHAELVENPEPNVLVLIEYACSYLRIADHEKRAKIYQKEFAHLKEEFTQIEKLDGAHLLKFIVECTKTNQFKSSRPRKINQTEIVPEAEEFPDF